MCIEKLTKKEIIYIYKKHLKKDFPRVERKPLSVIIKDYNAWEYVAFGLKENGDIIGYAFFVKRNNDYLLDYFAICSGLRDKGFGGKFIQLLANELKNADSIIAEIESPDYAKNSADKEIRTKRRKFYFNNGFVDTGVRPITFGVNFDIIEIPVSEKHDDEYIKTVYLEHYKTMTKRNLFKKIPVVRL